jgi:hypothetical protein
VGHKHSKGRLFLFVIFVALNDYKHTSFQLLALKGDDEVVIVILVAYTEYGTHNVLPSHLGVLKSHRVHLHNIHLLSYKVFSYVRSWNIVNIMWKNLG